MTRGTNGMLVVTLLLMCTACAQAQESMSCKNWVPGQESNSPAIELNEGPSDLSFKPGNGLSEDSGQGGSRGEIPPEECHSYVLDTGKGDVQSICYNKSLLLELYRLKKNEAGELVIDEPRNVADVDMFFLVAEGQRPTVETTQTNIVFEPSTRSRNSKPQKDAVFYDVVADKYQRPHHQILIHNVSADLNDKKPVWFITFANMNRGRSPGVAGYKFRATCLSDDELMCPRPLPNAGPCSSNPISDISTLSTLSSNSSSSNSSSDPISGGNIGSSNSSSSGNSTAGVQGFCRQVEDVDPIGAGGPFERQCECVEGFGDYGCHQEVTHIQTGSSTDAGEGIFKEEGIVIQEDEWRYYQIEVPDPSSSSRRLLQDGRQLLLVELERNAESEAGRQQLAVKPVDKRNLGVPFYRDPDFYDSTNAKLEQNLHYIVKTDFSDTNTFYVGVSNTDRGAVTASLRVKWATAEQPFICPADCGEHGQCVDPDMAQEPGASRIFPPFISPSDTGFLCRCDPGWTGLHCEGKLWELEIGRKQRYDSPLTLAPGQWDYHLLTVPPASFDFSSDILLIGWLAADEALSNQQNLFNAFLTVDQDQFPQQASPDRPNALQQGQVRRYPEMQPGIENSPRRLQVRGQALKSSSVYVIGFYNSDLDRNSPYDYRVELTVPQEEGGDLHPYMSVVIGVIAAIVLCLFFTLSRRVFLRHSMFSNMRTRMGVREFVVPENDFGDEPFDSGAPRRRGVLPETINTFPTFTYKPPAKTTEESEEGTEQSSRPSAPPHTMTAERRARLEAAAQAATDAGFGHDMRARNDANTTNNLRQGSARGLDQGSLTEGASGRSSEGAQEWVSVEHGGQTAIVHAIAHGNSTDPRGVMQVSSVGGHGVDGEASTRGLKSNSGGSAEGGNGEDGKAGAREGKRSSAGCVVGGSQSGEGESSEVSKAEGDGTTERGANQGKEKKEAESDEEPTCSVCLCEYEEGDLLRRLLPCNHEFHCTCIDKWMTQHHTCPICRVLLEPEIQAQPQQQQQQQQHQVGGDANAHRQGRGLHPGQTLHDLRRIDAQVIDSTGTASIAAATAANTGPPTQGQVALQIPTAGAAPPPQQHQDAPRGNGVLGAIASRIHPRALETFLSSGRQRPPQVGMGVGGPSLHEQHVHNQQQQRGQGRAEQQQPLGGGGLVGMVAQQGRMQAEEEGAANRASERRRQRQRPRERAQLRAPQSGWTSQPMPLMESPQPARSVPPHPAITASSASQRGAEQTDFPRMLPQLQHHDGHDVGRRASHSPSSSAHGGGVSGAEEHSDTEGRASRTHRAQRAHHRGHSAHSSADTEGSSPPSDPEAGALPRCGPKPPRSPPGNVASSSSSDGDAPSGPRAAPSIP